MQGEVVVSQAIIKGCSENNMAARWPVDISTIIFDLGGVLVLTHWDRVTQPLAELSGLSAERVLDEIVSGDASYPFMRGEFDQWEFHRRLSEQLKMDLSPERLFEIWPNIITPNGEINTLIEMLKRHYRLVLGSNTDVLHHRRSIEVQEALRHFDDALVSYELGCCKPDATFFSRGLDKLSASPEECVFIDDRKENVDAAQSQGIAAIRFSIVSQLESDLVGMGISIE